MECGLSDARPPRLLRIDVHGEIDLLRLEELTELARRREDPECTDWLLDFDGAWLCVSSADLHVFAERILQRREEQGSDRRVLRIYVHAPDPLTFGFMRVLGARLALAAIQIRVYYERHELEAALQA